MRPSQPAPTAAYLTEVVKQPVAQAHVIWHEVAGAARRLGVDHLLLGVTLVRLVRVHLGHRALLPSRRRAHHPLQIHPTRDVSARRAAIEPCRDSPAAALEWRRAPTDSLGRLGVAGVAGLTAARCGIVQACAKQCVVHDACWVAANGARATEREGVSSRTIGADDAGGRAGRSHLDPAVARSGLARATRQRDNCIAGAIVWCATASENSSVVDAHLGGELIAPMEERERERVSVWDVAGNWRQLGRGEKFWVGLVSLSVLVGLGVAFFYGYPAFLVRGLLAFTAPLL